MGAGAGERPTRNGHNRSTPPVAGLQIDAGCPDGGVAGAIDRTLPLWQAFYGSAHESLSLTRVNVAVARYWPIFTGVH